GDARDHEARVRLEQPVGAEVPALEGTRPEVLEQHIRTAGELEQDLLTALDPEVERAALLVPRLHRPPERAPLVAGLAPFAKRVRLPGRLDLDDLGAHVAEQPPRERPGEEHPELDDAHAGERARPVGAARRRRGLDGGRGPVSPAWIACTCATSRSRASNRCSFMTSSARSASRSASAFVICRW